MNFDPVHFGCGLDSTSSTIPLVVTHAINLIFLRLLQGIADSALLNGINVPAGAAFRDAAAIRANVNARCGTAF